MSRPGFDFNNEGETTNWMCGAVAKHWIGYSTPDSGADRQPGTVRKPWPLLIKRSNYLVLCSDPRLGDEKASLASFSSSDRCWRDCYDDIVGYALQAFS